MSKKELLWGGLCICLILLAYIIPFTILKNITFWYGSFLLWIILALLIIGINYILVKDWRD
ncbi:hypothetical protein [Fredinandcohnia quinoae]|uniref:Uncharacterized protein n=1 Tax=Fredinandcohnia quinoae TaxID=2918902 RepID=A0AAW5DXE6_9BACI|nr:hypothetical protein [Fredinandcohnia sp. SECRCQ15]MCH1623720.1 hypothetical protein [Fredinandcohnia sp. SECRCQ15]